MLGALLLLLKETKRLTKTLEVGVDSFRQVHGLPAAFHVEPSATISDPDAGRTVPHAPEPESNWLKYDILEALCREHHIPFDDSTDMILLGKEHGWLDSSGAIVALPTGYGE